MLDDKQKAQMINGFSIGLTDPLIAKKLGISHMQVFNFRKSCDISSADVKANRYRKWIEMLDRGDALDHIAKQYEVKPLSIRQALTRDMGYSFKEAAQKRKGVITPGVAATKRERG